MQSQTHCKMQRKAVRAAGIYDARALRVVVDDMAAGSSSRQAIAGCYRILAVIHRLWPPFHSQFDDYIVNAKRTGYQSLHTVRTSHPPLGTRPHHTHPVAR